MNRILILFCFSAILLTGCKKSGSPPVVIYDFSYGGTMYTYDAVLFQSTAPAGKSLFWSFGDGSTSTDSLPVHIYRRSGTFTASLVVGGDSVHVVKKNITVRSTTGRMWLNGLFITAAEVHQYKFWPIDHSVMLYTYGWPSSKFAITSLTDSTLSVTDSFNASLNTTESYRMIDSLCNDSVLVFTSHKYPFLLYDHKNDHIFFDFVFYGDPAGYIIQSFKLR